jgi:hypothetical protein
MSNEGTKYNHAMQQLESASPPAEQRAERARAERETGLREVRRAHRTRDDAFS